MSDKLSHKNVLHILDIIYNNCKDKYHCQMLGLTNKAFRFHLHETDGVIANVEKGYILEFGEDYITFSNYPTINEGDVYFIRTTLYDYVYSNNMIKYDHFWTNKIIHHKIDIKRFFFEAITKYGTIFEWHNSLAEKWYVSIFREYKIEGILDE